MITDPIQALKNEISSSGLKAPDHLKIGKINRFSDDGGRNRNGWCSLFVNPDGTAGGAYGNWKDINKKWFFVPEGHCISLDQQEHLNKQIREVQVKAKQELKKKQKKAAIKAQEIWDRSQQSDPNHGYLVKKQIKPYLRQDKPGTSGKEGINSLKFVIVTQWV
jgi:putative DNA primase/helicase